MKLIDCCLLMLRSHVTKNCIICADFCEGGRVANQRLRSIGHDVKDIRVAFAVCDLKT